MAGGILEYIAKQHLSHHLRWIEDNNKKESTMTAKEMLEAPIYNAASECLKCGSTETEDEYYGVVKDVVVSIPPFFRIVNRKCLSCKFRRLEKPKDWTDAERLRLILWCAALEDKEKAEKAMKSLIHEADNE